MRHIIRFESYSTQDRLDDILDKISRYGKEYLTDLESKFLGSYSNGNQDSVHDEIKLVENEILFEDDQGYFKFEFKDCEDLGDEIHYRGTLYVPDLKFDKSTINGCLEGTIIKFKNNNTVLEFEVDGYDVLEFCGGLEYELDSFVDYVIDEIDQKMNIIK